MTRAEFCGWKWPTNDWPQCPDTEQEPKECTPGKFCAAFDMFINPLANEGKGFRALAITKNVDKHPRDHQRYIAGVVMSKGGKDDGIVLNYCPFCGKSTRWENLPNYPKPKESASEDQSSEAEVS